MAGQFNPTDFSRYSDFNIHTTPYKTVSGHHITADVLIPKKLTSANPPAEVSSPRPIVLRFHGGGLVTASSLFPDFFSKALLKLADNNSAIIVSPDYRFLPESTAEEILSDLEDFWNWIQTALPAYVAERTNNAVAADTSRIVSFGESAGGYLSLQLGLSHPDKIRAVTAAYPMLDLGDRFFREPFEKRLFGMEQDFPKEVFYDAHVEKVRAGELPSVVSSDPLAARMPLMLSYIQKGIFANDFPLEKRELFPLFRLEDGARFPRGGVFIWHGNEDSLVPIEGSKKLKAKVAELDPELKFRLEIRPGEHGFDGETRLEEEWFAEGIRSIVEAWLA